MAVKYLENVKGALAIGNKVIAQLESISINLSVTTDEVATFDQNFVKTYTASWKGYTFDATGVVDDITTGYANYTGGTAANTFTGTTNGGLLFEQAKNRSTLTFVLKHDNNSVERGNCIVQSCDIKNQAGKFQTFSIKGVLTTDLVKSST